MTARRAWLAVTIALTAYTPRVHAATAVADSASHASLLSRRDAVYAFGTAGAIAIAASNDRAWSVQASADRSRRAHDIATASRHLGDPLSLAPVLLATDALARLTGHERLGAASERVALAVAGAGALKILLGQVIGRSRPDESPGTPDHYAPFSGHDAMPSGHTAVAFALAASVSAEAPARWVPFVLYPAAGLTAWSRVHDREHWTSDVVAGAAMGAWVGHTLDRIAQRRLPHGVLPIVWPGARGAVAGLRVSF